MFYNFLAEWGNFVIKQKFLLVAEGEGQWELIPGYSKLLQIFFEIIKNLVPTKEMPDSLVKACNQLLHNEKIITTLIEIQYNKTK